MNLCALRKWPQLTVATSVPSLLVDENGLLLLFLLLFVLLLFLSAFVSDGRTSSVYKKPC